MISFKVAILILTICIMALSGYCAYLHLKINDFNKKLNDANIEITRNRHKLYELDYRFNKSMIKKAGIKHGRKEN